MQIVISFRWHGNRGLNRNGTDDLLDIRYGESRDRNKNGIVDEVERRREQRNAR